MTENEFIKLCTDVDFLNQVGKDNVLAVAYEALRIAKTLGTNFDPEPADLPKLKYSPLQYPRYTTHDCGYMILTDNSSCPDIDQAREIVRRCQIVSRLREYIAKRFTRLPTGAMVDVTTHELSSISVGDILDILNGKGE